jgi:uncharacterized protein with PIN domain
VASSNDDSSTIWVDAQLPPALARWLRDLGESRSAHVAELGLLSAPDPEIFEKARQAAAVVVTKDSDFVQIQERRKRAGRGLRRRRACAPRRPDLSEHCRKAGL